MAKDKIKDSVGYKDGKSGVSAMLDYTHEFAADFGLSVAKEEDNIKENSKTIYVAVKNNGTIMDTGKVEMYVNGTKTGDPVHYELGPGEEKLIPFTVAKDGGNDVMFTTKYKAVEL